MTIVTAQWQPHWPRRICYHEVPVVRLSPPPEGDWETGRYVRALRRWLAENQDRCDLACVSGLEHEAEAAIRTVGGRVPVVLRAEAAGPSGDCLWQIDAPAGRRIKHQCLKADALVGPTPAIERELQAAGYPRSRIHRILDGVAIPPPRTATTRLEARSVLAAAADKLKMPDRARLAVYAGRLQPGRGLSSLLQSWKSIVGRWPGARLWLAGDGPDKAALREQIAALGLTGRAALVGVFDQIATLLAAAEVFVWPSAESDTSRSLLEAMAAGLPIVAADTSAHRSVIADAREGLLVPPADPDALATAIARLMNDGELAARLGAAARQRAVEEFSLAKMVQRHVTLFERLAQHANLSDENDL